ncbi:MAG: DbpA RNA binding domain-containing protein, partial [Paracoccaceae bacterium]
HRSGRTGRAGRKGVSALIVPPAEAKKAQRLLAGAKVVAEWVKAPSADEVQAKDDQRILEHPALSEAVGDEAAMVSTLIERFGAEQTAAAFIRLWREGRSAPEVLSDSLPPPPASAPRERSEFGPSVWFTLTVGHSGRAEARWILPKICDGAGISKDGIGAIRVKEDVTYVQIAEPLAGRFGPQLELEAGLIMSRMEGEPSLDRPERAPRPARDDRPAYKAKPSRVVEDDAIIAAPAPARKPYVKRDDAERKPYAPRDDAERKPYAPRAAAERTPYAKREDSDRKPYAPREGAERKPYAKREDADRKPYAPRAGAAPKPYAKREDAPAGGAKFKSAGFKSFGGSADKPARAAGFKSHASEGTGYKPKAEGDRAEKRTYAPKGDDARPSAKRDGKPAGKAAGFKAGGDGKKPFARKSDAPARPRADAKDTSKRFVPPKGAKR